MTLRLASSSRSAAADAVVDRIDVGGAGNIKIYTGAQPADPQTAPTGTLLATIPLNNPAFTVATTGVANLIVVPTVTGNGVADGVAGWFRVTSGGGSAVFDGQCGTGAPADLVLDTTTISTGLPVTIISGTYTQPQ